MKTPRLRTAVMHGTTWALIALLVLGYLISSVIYNSTQVKADSVTSRKIQMSTSEEAATASYVISFTVPDAGTQNIGSFRVEFCNGDPIPNTTCSFTTANNVPNLNSATLGSASFDDTGGTDQCSVVSLASISAGDRHLDFTCNTADDISAAGNFTATVNNIVNPTNATESPNNPNNTFYARLYVYTATTPTAIANPVTGDVHDGGLAISTAEQLTITARVQEVLEFCVGDTEAVTGSGDDCTDISGNDIDLDVLDFTSVNDTDTLNQSGWAMVRTNAASGVVVDYFAEQETSSGKLKVVGASCSGVSTTDQCINSAGTTASTIVAGTEEFGMTITTVDTTGGGQTTNLTRDGQYDNASEYAFDDTGTADRIASSSTVVDDEMLQLDWAATAAVTTPTGVYTTTLTFIATPTF